MALTTLNLLGSRGKRILVLGGGDGEVLSHLYKYPQVEEVVVVEIDEVVVETVKQASTWFPGQANSLNDARTKLVIQDALEWLHRPNTSTFDAIFVCLEHQPWLQASRGSRVPRTFRFLRRLRTLLNPGGILLQDIGSISSPQHVQRMLAMHRVTFSDVWPLAYSSIEDKFDDALERRVRQAPRLLVLSSLAPLDPLAVDWERWRSLKIETNYYHPGMHEASFVLPAELQRLLLAKPPSSAHKTLPERRHDCAESGACIAAMSPPGEGGEDERLSSPQRPQMAGEISEETALVFGYFIEAHGCSFTALNDTAGANSLLEDLAALGQLTLVKAMDKQFVPQGLTALLLVEESHLSIHTWPELGYAVLDIVSCKAMNADMRRSFSEATRARLGCREVTAELGLRGHGYGREGGFKPVEIHGHMDMTSADAGRHTTPSKAEL